MTFNGKRLQHADFLKAYDELAEPIFRHCYFRVRSREVAQDIMQDTFTRTWKYIADGGEIDNLKAFLYRTAHNLIVDGYRKQAPVSLDQLQEAGFDPSDRSDQVIIQLAERQYIMEMLNVLDEKTKQVIIYRYIDDMSVKGIAELLEETENAISVRLHRGLKKLESQYGQ